MINIRRVLMLSWIGTMAIVLLALLIMR